MPGAHGRPRLLSGQCVSWELTGRVTWGVNPRWEPHSWSPRFALKFASVPHIIKEQQKLPTGKARAGLGQ